MQNKVKYIAELIEKASGLTGHKIEDGKDFSFYVQLPGRRSDLSLPKDKMAVYSFYLASTEECLKVGQTTDNQRFQFDHYYKAPRKWSSTLAKSVYEDSDKEYLGPDVNLSDSKELKQVLKDRTLRIDVLLDRFAGNKHAEKIELNFIEGLLQLALSPRYEG